MKQSERYKAGWEKLKEIDGEAGEKVLTGLKNISPDLGRFIIEYAFGDIYTRDGLDLKSREIAVVAALTAMGTARPQLKVHMNGALNTGSSINEIKEELNFRKICVRIKCFVIFKIYLFTNRDIYCFARNIRM